MTFSSHVQRDKIANELFSEKIVKNFIEFLKLLILKGADMNCYGFNW